MSEDIYVCDRCKSEITYEQIGYLGSETENCSPFMDLDCYCQDCYDRLEERGE